MTALSMLEQGARFFLLEDLESRSKKLAESDLEALHTVADWIRTFVAQPHKDLGRDGPVCPFVPSALERKTLWLAPERIADGDVDDVVRVVDSYRKLFLNAQPSDGPGAAYKSIAVVFSDLSPIRAQEVFSEVLQRLAARFYSDDGLVLGAFYEGNEGTALYNSRFQPFTAPVPFLLMRHAVVSDWKFFLDDGDWLKRWAHRYGEAGAQALGEVLRRMPWRASGQPGNHPPTTSPT